MRWILFIIILAPCYALEVIICEEISGSYDCQIYSEPEKPYLEDVIHVTESEGFNTNLAGERNGEVDEEKPLDSGPYYTPLIFPVTRYW
jgi:hypothetical protein